MSNTLLIKRSSIPNAVPTTANVALGELAINTHDGRLFTKIDTGTPSIFELTQNQPISLSGNVTGVSVNGVGNSLINVTLTTTGVSSGTYGGTSGATSNIGVFTVDQYGRITSASNVAISTSSLANGNSNIEIYANGNISINPGGASNVVVIATTGQYVDGLVSVTGNVISNNVQTGIVTASGNVTGANFDTAGVISSAGTVTAGNVDTGGTVSATGNITGGNIDTAGIISAAGTATVGNVATGGTVSATGNITGGNIDTTGIISATGTVTAGNIDTSGTISATGNVTTGNLSTGIVTASGNVTGANIFTGGVVSATGNITGGNVSTAGNVAANGVLTDNYYYANGTPVDFQQAAGSNTQIQFNDNNDFGASANLTFDSANSVFGIIGTATVTGTVTAGNVDTAGVISAAGTVTAGNVATGGTVSATGNITGGNIDTAGEITGNGNITISGYASIVGDVIGGNISTAGNVTGDYVIANTAIIDNISVSGNISVNSLTSNTFVSAVGNVVGGNVLTDGFVSVQGNVIGGNLVTGGVANVTGNVIGGNIETAGAVSATGNVIGGNLSTAGLATVSGNITGGNLFTGGAVSATGNVTGGNIETAGAISAAGNATTGNLSTGIVTASGNITGANLFTGGSVSATGNVISGNVETGIISASGNVTGANFLSGGLASITGNVTGGNLIATTAVVTGNVASTGSMNITTGSGDLNLAPAGNINADNHVINNLGAPQLATDAVTKQYVDDAVSSGIHIHTPVYVETPVALPSSTYTQGGTTYTVTDTIAGNTVVFSTPAGLQPNDQLWFSNSFNGIVGNLSYFVVSTPNTSAAVLSTAYNGVPVSNITNGSSLTESVTVNPGVGATLTATANGALTIDSVSVTATQRVLVYQQAVPAENGIYVVTDAGNVTAPWILTRASDADMYIPDTNNGLDQGTYVYVQSGATGAGESYVMTQPAGPFIIGYDNIEFTQFSASQVYSANTSAGLSLTGTVFSAKVDNNTTEFDIGGNIVVKASANLTTPNIGAATGTSLSVTGNIDGSNLTVTTANVTNLNVSNVSVSGNVSAESFTATTFVSATGNVTGGNILTSGIISATGDITGNNLQLNDTANVATLIVRTLANIVSTTVSTSNTTGALTVAGGIGVTGNIYADGMYVFGDSVLTVNSTIDGGTY